jgi:RNA polymerase sigma factor (sigma-70 family)
VGDAQRAIEAVWRIESARVVAGLARMVRDVGLAEELAQDALVAALETWPATGVPDNPGAWLMATAKRRAIDQLRRRAVLERKYAELAREEPAGEPEDDLLGLLFMTCHPVLASEARVALTLRLLGGLTTEEIARAFLVSEATMAQRIVRAKKKLSTVAFEWPDDLEARLASVLEVIYLVFNEGYAATSGERWFRPDLCFDALRLGRMVAEVAPREPEVHGLVALMELQASRLRARTGPDGRAVLLEDQDRARWDFLLIERGREALARARRLGAKPGPYVLQAEIAACHASLGETDWVRVAALYEALARLNPSPVVELNRAVALSRAFGPAVGLQLVDALADEPALAEYHLLPGVRGDLLERLGRHAEARAEFAHAASLARNEREREVLSSRATSGRSRTS